MTKYHNIISVVVALGFLVIVQIFSTPFPIFRFLAPAFFAYAAAVSFYNRWYLRQIEKYNIWTIFRLALFLLAGLGIFLLIPSGSLRGLFLVVTVVLIALFEYAVGNFAENILINETLLTAFGLFVTILGFKEYFAQIYNNYSLLFILAIFSSTFLLSRAFYQFIPQSNHTKLLASIILGLFVGQIFWALAFLPLHFSALAVILFNIFYFCLILNYYYFFQTLTLKKVQFHLVLIAVCSGLVVLSTPWKIIL